MSITSVPLHLDTMLTLVRAVSVAITGDPDVSVNFEPPNNGSRAARIRVRVDNPIAARRFVGRSGETIKAMQRVVTSMSWRTEYNISLVMDEFNESTQKGEYHNGQQQQQVNG